MAYKQQPPFVVPPQPTTLGTGFKGRKRKNVLELATTKKKNVWIMQELKLELTSVLVFHAGDNYGTQRV